MQKPITPFVGEWYMDHDGQRMEVVAFDEDEGTVEVQLFDGTVEALELADWRGMVARRIAAPEDWSGPYDDVDEEDMGDTERPRRPTDWDGPWNELDEQD